MHRNAGPLLVQVTLAGQFACFQTPLTNTLVHLLASDGTKHGKNAVHGTKLQAKNAYLEPFPSLYFRGTPSCTAVRGWFSRLRSEKIGSKSGKSFSFIRLQAFDHRSVSREESPTRK